MTQSEPIMPPMTPSISLDSTHSLGKVRTHSTENEKLIRSHRIFVRKLCRQEGIQLSYYNTGVSTILVAENIDLRLPLAMLLNTLLRIPLVVAAMKANQ